MKGEIAERVERKIFAHKMAKKWRTPADDKERETCYTGIVPNWDKRKGRTSV